MAEIEVRWSKTQGDVIEFRHKDARGTWDCVTVEEARVLGAFARRWDWSHSASSRRQLWYANGFKIYADNETPGVFDAYGSEDVEPSTHATLEDAKRGCYEQAEGGR